MERSFWFLSSIFRPKWASVQLVEPILRRGEEENCVSVSVSAELGAAIYVNYSAFLYPSRLISFTLVRLEELVVWSDRSSRATRTVMGLLVKRETKKNFLACHPHVCVLWARWIQKTRRTRMERHFDWEESQVLRRPWSLSEL